MTDYRQRCADAAMKAWGEQAVLCDHSQIIPIGSIVDAVLAVENEVIADLNDLITQERTIHEQTIQEVARLRAESADLRAAVGRDIAIIGQLRQQLDAAQATRDETHVWTNTDWKERAEQAAAALADLNWLIAAGVDIIIGAVDHNGGADLRVALDLEDEPDDNPAWYGPLGESLADARAHCEALGIGP